MAKEIGLFEGTWYDTVSLQEIFDHVDQPITTQKTLIMLDNALRLPILLTEKEYTSVSRSKERLKSTTNEKLSSLSDGYAFYLGLNTMSGKVIGVSNDRNTVTLEVWQGNKSEWQNFTLSKEVGGLEIDVNGKKVEFDVPPQIINDRTMIPIRAVVEAFGAKVEWEPKFREIYISGKIVASKDPSRVGKIINIDLQIERDNLLYVVTDEIPTNISSAFNTEFYSTETLDSSPLIVDDRTLVPLRAIVELFGYFVEWDANTKTVKIK